MSKTHGIITTVTLTGMSALSATGRAALGRSQPQRLSPFNQEEVMHKTIWKNTSIDCVRVPSNTFEIRTSDEYGLHVIVAATPYVCVRFMNKTKAYINSGLVWRDPGDVWQLVKVRPNMVELQLIIGGAYETGSC
jgi:hypothetical protein